MAALAGAQIDLNSLSGPFVSVSISLSLSVVESFVTNGKLRNLFFPGEPLPGDRNEFGHVSRTLRKEHKHPSPLLANCSILNHTRVDVILARYHVAPRRRFLAGVSEIARTHDLFVSLSLSLASITITGWVVHAKSICLLRHGDSRSDRVVGFRSHGFMRQRELFSLSFLCLHVCSERAKRDCTADSCID